MLEKSFFNVLYYFKKTKTLNCTNNFAYCTPNTYFIKKAYKNDTTDQTYDYLTHWRNGQGSRAKLKPGDLVNMVDSSPIFRALNPSLTLA